MRNQNPPTPRRDSVGRRSPVAVMLAAALALAVAACEDDETVEVLPPPIEVRSTVPADGVSVNPAPGELLDLSVVFTRAPGAGTIRFTLYPPPGSAGDYGPTGTGRSWAWLDVELLREAGAHFWLIDGLQMPRPTVVRLVTAERSSGVGFLGAIASVDTNLANPRGAVVFSLPPFAPFNPLEPESFLSVDKVAATVVRGEPNAQGFWPIDQGYLAEVDSVQVVAILDTDGDTVYDPTLDWWGYHREEGSTGPEIVRAAVKLSPEAEDVSIILGPPGFRGRGTPDPH